MKILSTGGQNPAGTAIFGGESNCVSKFRLRSNCLNYGLFSTGAMGDNAWPCTLQFRNGVAS